MMPFPIKIKHPMLQQNARRCLILILTCLTPNAWSGEWVDREWPAVFQHGGAGEQMTVRQIDLSLKRLATRGATGARRSFDGLLFGPHLSLTDLPFGRIGVLRDAIRQPDSDISRGLLAQLHATGCNAVRIYDAYWWDPLGAEASVRVQAHFGHVAANQIDQRIESWSYPDAGQVFSYLSGQGFDVAMVVSTIYLDPDSKKVYTTKQVCDDVDGVLDKAAQRNAAALAHWWKQHGHGRRLILEIGNEGIGYSNDKCPSIPQYAKLIAAFVPAIHRANPDVEIAIVIEPLESKNDNPGYQYGPEMRELLRLCQPVANHIDHVIVHFYDRHSRDYSLTYPNDAVRMLDLLSADMDANGMKLAKVCITEYTFDLWSRHRDTVGIAVANASRQIAIAGHPRVSGMFLHNAPGCQLFHYSDGQHWTSAPPGSMLHRKQAPNEHPADTFGEKLGPRFRMLPTGDCHALLARACGGELIDAFAMDNFGQIAYLITRDGPRYRFLVTNLQPQTLRIRLPELRDASIRIFQGQSWDAVPVDALEQPYGITVRNAQALSSIELPPFSVGLLEGMP